MYEVVDEYCQVRRLTCTEAGQDSSRCPEACSRNSLPAGITLLFVCSMLSHDTSKKK